MVEQRPFKPKVVGSIPTAPTNYLVVSKGFAGIAQKEHCCILVQSVREVSVFSQLSRVSVLSLPHRNQ